MNNYTIIYSLLMKHEKVTKAMREARKLGMRKQLFIETRNKYGIKNWKKSREKYLNFNIAANESETESNDKEKTFSPYSPYSPCSPRLTWTWKDERKDSGISEIIMAACEDESAYIHSLPLDENHNDNNNHNIDDDEYSLNILDKIDDNFLYINENETDETDETDFERFLDIIREQKVNC